MVYFISDGEFIKIGIATNIKSRLCKLQTGNARPLKVVKLIEGYRKTERIFHNLFKYERLEGEWFDITEEQVNNYTQNYKDITGNYTFFNEKERPVYCNDGMSITEYKSITNAMNDTGVHHSAISRCCQGKRKSAGGYNWAYKK